MGAPLAWRIVYARSRLFGVLRVLSPLCTGCAWRSCMLSVRGHAGGSLLFLHSVVHSSSAQAPKPPFRLATMPACLRPLWLRGLLGEQWRQGAPALWVRMLAPRRPRMGTQAAW